MNYIGLTVQIEHYPIGNEKLLKMSHMGVIGGYTVRKSTLIAMPKQNTKAFLLVREGRCGKGV